MTWALPDAPLRWMRLADTPLHWTRLADVPLHWVADFCVLAAALGIVYVAVASVLILRFTAKRRAAPSHHRPVTILVPLCGDGAGLYARLAALCTQEYTAPVQLICGVHDADDPAIKTVRKVAADFPHQAIDLQVDSKEYGSNRKISNLINMAKLARHDIFVIIDSDIVVKPGYLADVIGELQKPGVGAVSCVYHGISGAGIWASLSAMGINIHFLPGVVTALTFGLARPCFGATIAISRSVLKTIGNFQAFADCLFDDYAIGASVRAAGYEVAVLALSIGHVCLERKAGALLLNQLRYARTIRAIDPAGYAGSIITHPVPLALLAMLLGNSRGFILLVIALGCRFGLCLCVEQALALPRQSYWLLPVRDVLSFAVYATSFFGTHLSWRGERYRLALDGSLIQDSG
jgi:ceramide glucosyltransferase